MLARIAFVVVLLSFAGPALAGETGVNVRIGYQYRDFQINRLPFSIAAGPDGTIWYTDALTPKIYRITLDGTSTSFPAEMSGDVLYGIRPGPDGNMWFLDLNQQSIGR